MLEENEGFPLYLFTRLFFCCGLSGFRLLNGNLRLPQLGLECHGPPQDADVGQLSAHEDQGLVGGILGG